MLTTASSLNSMWLRDQSAQRLSRDRKDRSLAERQRGVTTMRAHRRDEGERDLEDRLSRGDGTPEEALDWFQRHEFPERSTPPTWDGERWLFTDGTDDDFDDFDDVAPAPGRGSLADPGTGNAPGTSSLPYDGPWSSRRVIPPALWSTDIRPTPAPRPLPPVGPVDPSRLPKPRPLDKFRPQPEVVPGLIGPSLDVVEQRRRAALESLELQTQSALASAFVAISTLRGERSPERLLAVAQAGHLLGEFASVIAGVAPHAVRVRNPAVDSVRDRKAPQVQKPIRTAQSVVQAKVDEFVKDFHREPARIADHVSEKEVHAVAAAVEQFHAGTMPRGSCAPRSAGRSARHWRRGPSSGASGRACSRRSARRATAPVGSRPRPTCGSRQASSRATRSRSRRSGRGWRTPSGTGASTATCTTSATKSRTRAFSSACSAADKALLEAQRWKRLPLPFRSGVHA
jgi:hypothetical protein